MLPVKSNTVKQGCTPVSSNCVVWQGPDISCINLCTGDTVSTVMYKVATDLCTLKSTLDLTTLNLSCLVEFCTTVGPAPTTKTLSAVLDYIVKKVCCLNDLVEAGGGGTGGGIGGGGGGGAAENLALPQCLQYQSAGQTVTQLSNDAYTLHLGTRFCTLKTDVDTMKTDVNAMKLQIIALENSPVLTIPKVTPFCILPPVSTSMNTVLTELEKQYCLLRTTLGTNSQLTGATAQICTGLNNASTLSQPGIMSNIPGWNVSVTNLAQSFQNLWLTICDMRAAVASLKNCCGSVDCTQFVLNYDASTNNDRTVVTLDFNPGTIIPAGFVNGVNGTTIEIKNVGGSVIKTYTGRDLIALATSGVFTATVAGANVEGGTLNASQPYEVTVTGTITKDGKTCTTPLTKIISVPCPIITNVTATLITP